MAELKLLPCPFCGSKRLKIESKRNGQWYYTATVRCNKCHARGGTASCEPKRCKYHADSETEQKAIEAWNRRVGNG